MKKLKLGILSTSRIVEEFLTAASQLEGWELHSICCRPQSREKAARWAQQYGIGEVVTDEAAYFARHDYDAVYIGTANHLHFDTARRALLAGHSVILEKPFTTSRAEAEELFRLADEQGVMVLEAITTSYLPRLQFMKEQLANIGPVKGVMANFCARSRRYDEYLEHIWNTTFDPACFGGALNDMNLYNLYLLWEVLGDPVSCRYLPNRGYNGIDTGGLALLKYEGFTAACLSAKDSQAENACTIQGPKGCLVLHGSPNGLDGELYALLGEGRDGHVRVDAPAQTRHRMCYEFDEFSRILAEQDKAAEAKARRATLAIMGLIDALHASEETTI